MKANYNEVLEKEMDELLKPLYEYGYDGDGQFTYLLDELKNKFKRAKFTEVDLVKFKIEDYN